MWPFRRRPAPPPALASDPLSTLNIADALRVLMVEKVTAEVELERMKLADRRAEAERKANGRERQREAGRNRSRRAKRANDGSFQSNQGGGTGVCFICTNPGKGGFTMEQLTYHREHRGQLRDDTKHLMQ